MLVKRVVAAIPGLVVGHHGSQLGQRCAQVIDGGAMLGLDDGHTGAAVGQVVAELIGG
jgi:hypothetical protein